MSSVQMLMEGIAQVDFDLRARYPHEGIDLVAITKWTILRGMIATFWGDTIIYNMCQIFEDMLKEDMKMQYCVDMTLINELSLLRVEITRRLMND